MAEKNRRKRKPSRAGGIGKPTGRRPNQGRFGASRYLGGSITVHKTKPSESEDRQAFVYILQDAKGLVKIGFTQNLLARLTNVTAIVPPEHRPVRLVRAIKIRRDLAYKIERFAHFLLQPRHIAYEDFREWFRAPPSMASRYVNQAAAIIVKADRAYPHGFYWRKVLEP